MKGMPRGSKGQRAVQQVARRNRKQSMHSEAKPKQSNRAGDLEPQQIAAIVLIVIAIFAFIMIALR